MIMEPTEMSMPYNRMYGFIVVYLLLMCVCILLIDEETSPFGVNIYPEHSDF